MLKPNWSVQNEIKKRADKEAWVKWWETLPKSKLVELKKVKVLKDNAGWYNLIANALRELKP